jgi:HK97 family phage major capsid protein
MTPEQMQEIAKNVADQLVEKSRGERTALVTKGEEPGKFSALKNAATFGAFLKAVANNRAGGRDELAKHAVRFGGLEMSKAIQESVFDSAGALVPIQYATDVIEFLRPVSLMDKLGVQMVPFKYQLEIPKQLTGASLTWIGEGDTTPETKPTFGKVILRAKKGMALINLSNDLVRNPAVGDAFVGEEARAAMAHGVDSAALNGTGAGNQPTGLLAQVHSDNKFVRSGTDASDYVADIDQAVEMVLAADINIGSPAWLMSPRKASELMGLRDAGGWLFREEMLGGKTLRGMPFVVSTRVPTEKLVFGDFRHFIYGVDEDVNVSMHTDTRAAYDETVLRAIVRVDFKVRHDKAFSVVSDS